MSLIVGSFSVGFRPLRLKRDRWGLINFCLTRSTGGFGKQCHCIWLWLDPRQSWYQPSLSV